VANIGKLNNRTTCSTPIRRVGEEIQPLSHVFSIVDPARFVDFYERDFSRFGGCLFLRSFPSHPGPAGLSSTREPPAEMAPVGLVSGVAANARSASTTGQSRISAVPLRCSGFLRPNRLLLGPRRISQPSKEAAAMQQSAPRGNKQRALLPARLPLAAPMPATIQNMRQHCQWRHQRSRFQRASRGVAAFEANARRLQGQHSTTQHVNKSSRPFHRHITTAKSPVSAGVSTTARKGSPWSSPTEQRTSARRSRSPVAGRPPGRPHRGSAPGRAAPAQTPASAAGQQGQSRLKLARSTPRADGARTADTRRKSAGCQLPGPLPKHDTPGPAR